MSVCSVCCVPNGIKKKKNNREKTCTFLKTIIIAKILVFSITDANIILAEFKSIYKIGKD